MSPTNPGTPLPPHNDPRPGDDPVVRLALPKGRMKDGVNVLLADAGIRLSVGARAYRPAINLDNFDVKILKPQSIVEMLHVGRRDLGFAGADWVGELQADLVELLDTGLDPVRVVAAAPVSLLDAEGQLPREGTPDGNGGARRLIIASEYQRLTQAWIEREGMQADCIRSFGATEVFPPEDADCIVDNTATGATLRANGLEIVHTVMTSSTRLYAHPKALDVPARRDAIERLVMLLRSVLDARTRVMLEVNVGPDQLEGVIAALPCMREPTVSPLHGSRGFAVKAAVPRSALPTLIPEIKAQGGTDIVVTRLAQLVS